MKRQMQQGRAVGPSLAALLPLLSLPAALCGNAMCAQAARADANAPSEKTSGIKLAVAVEKQAKPPTGKAATVKLAAPEAPAGLRVERRVAGSTTVAFEDNSLREARYIVQRASARGDYKYGINAHPFDHPRSEAYLASMWNAVEAAGLQHVRLHISWAYLETAQGQYDAAQVAWTDRIINEAAARGLRLIITVFGIPEWVNGHNPNEGRQFIFAGEPIPKFAAFFVWLARRYQGRDIVWEVWNEPNEGTFWRVPNGGNGQGQPNAGQYAYMCSEVYTRVKAAVPSCTIIVGSLLNNAQGFLGDVYAAWNPPGTTGVANCDGISIHPYCLDRPPGVGTGNTPDLAYGRYHSFVDTLHDTRDFMAARPGLAGKGIWITEYGWPVAPGAAVPPVTEELRARYYRESVQIIESTFPQVRCASPYLLHASEPAGMGPPWGLVNDDGTAKPGFRSYVDTANAAVAGKFVQVASIGARPGTGTIRYHDKSTASQRWHAYRVIGVNAAGQSAPSNITVAQAGAPAKPQPRKLQTTASRTANKTAKAQGQKKPAPAGLSLEEARQNLLDYLNRERSREGLAPLAFEPSAMTAAERHVQDMTEGDYVSSYDRQGKLFEQRYTESGGSAGIGAAYLWHWNTPRSGAKGASSQGASSQKMEVAEPRFAEADLARIKTVYLDLRPQIVSPATTHVGLGLSKAANGNATTVRHTLLFISSLLAEVDAIPQKARVGEEITVSGRLSEGTTLDTIAVGRGPLPVPLTRAQLKPSLPWKRPPDHLALTPQNVTVSASGRFAVEVPLSENGRPGLYHISIWVRLKKPGGGEMQALASSRTIVVENAQ